MSDSTTCLEYRMLSINGSVRLKRAGLHDFTPFMSQMLVVCISKFSLGPSPSHHRPLKWKNHSLLILPFPSYACPPLFPLGWAVPLSTPVCPQHKPFLGTDSCYQGVTRWSPWSWALPRHAGIQALLLHWLGEAHCCSCHWGIQSAVTWCPPTALTAAHGVPID